MNRERVGDERGGKEADGCPLTAAVSSSASKTASNAAFQSAPE
jgi:hypothetical protein